MLCDRVAVLEYLRAKPRLFGMWGFSARPQTGGGVGSEGCELQCGKGGSPCLFFSIRGAG